MPEEKKPIRFAQLLEKHVNNVVKRLYEGQPSSQAVLKSVHETVRREVDIVFNRSSYKLAPEARSWLCDQLFKVIPINHEFQIGERVIMNEYNLESLPYHDVELLRNLFNETQMASQLEEEYRRRSRS
jgi:hypothetical protein